MKTAKMFLIKLTLFLLPAVLLFSPVVLSGEVLNSGWVARIQAMGVPLLYGPRYAETHLRYYKSLSATLHNPAVLVLGDSRPLEVRSFFFNDGVDVYNAAYSAPTPTDMLYFLKNHQDNQIEVLLLSISHFAFNGNYSPVQELDHEYFSNPRMGDGMSFAGAARSIWDAVAAGVYSVADIYTHPGCVGINAQAYGNGILNDGSYYYGDAYLREASGQTAGERIYDTLINIENGLGRFSHAEHANPKALEAMYELLDYCRKLDIYVIGFAPPYAPSVNEAIAQNGEAYGYQSEMLSEMPGIFLDYGYEFFDYTDVAHLGCGDENFVDGYHAGDVVFARMFIDMIKKGSLLAQLSRAGRLEQLCQDAASPLRLLNSWQDYDSMAQNRAA